MFTYIKSLIFIVFILFIIYILYLSLVYINKNITEHYNNNIDTPLLNNMEMESINVFKEYNQVAYRQFMLSLKQYNHLKTLYPYSKDNLIYLNKRLIDLYDSMTFHLPYLQLTKVALGIRYELKVRLENDRSKFMNEVKYASPISSDEGKQLSIPENRSPIWF